MKLLLGIIST